MIKRHYFMSVEKPHADGSGSYSFNSCTAVYISIFPDQNKIYKEMSMRMEEKMKDIKGDKIQVIAFNRI